MRARQGGWLLRAVVGGWEWMHARKEPPKHFGRWVCWEMIASSHTCAAKSACKITQKCVHTFAPSARDTITPQLAGTTNPIAQHKLVTVFEGWGNCTSSKHSSTTHDSHCIAQRRAHANQWLHVLVRKCWDTPPSNITAQCRLLGLGLMCAKPECSPPPPRAQQRSHLVFCRHLGRMALTAGCCRCSPANQAGRCTRCACRCQCRVRRSSLAPAGSRLQCRRARQQAGSVSVVPVRLRHPCRIVVPAPQTQSPAR
jgi:hypothetical protein